MTKRNRILMHCLQCTKPFDTTLSLYRSGKGRFCSRPCAYTWQAERASTVERLAERFRANVNTAGPTPTHVPDLGPCHVWTGHRNEYGYGKIAFRGRGERAHRAAFFLADGRWPASCALHRCDNPACVRREHLFEGTKADNSRDMAAKKRTGAQTHPEKIRRGDQHWSRFHPDRVARGDRNGRRKHPERYAHIKPRPESIRRGEANGTAKLTAAAVLEIRAGRAAGERLRILAKRYGVTEALVSMVSLRKVWRHI